MRNCAAPSLDLKFPQVGFGDLDEINETVDLPHWLVAMTLSRGIFA
jgi:hypothetical protein